MELIEIMEELKGLGNERTKKQYLHYGAREDLLYGVSIKDMKPIAKGINHNNEMAMALFDTGNYDAMYLAGMIVNPKEMTKEIFNHWMSKAYFYMIGDYIVSVSLAETGFALELAAEWMESDEELKQSAGWSTYTWVLGVRKDSEIDKNEIAHRLHKAKTEIGAALDRTKHAMDLFIAAVGISYRPLHEEALEAAAFICEVYPEASAEKSIKKAVAQNRIGFKRKNVRC